MKRVKFKKGEQRKFLERVIYESGAPSLRSLNQFGFDVPYSTWKNYFTELRHLPDSLFFDLCEFVKVNPKDLDIDFLDENYGQIKGGKHSRNK